MDVATKLSPEKEGRLSPSPLFPDSVAFRQNDPKNGYVYIIINISGVKVQGKLVGKTKPLNVDILDEATIFEPKNIRIRLNVTKDGKIEKYEYKKSLAKELDPKASDVKFEKNGQIILRIKKLDTAISWAPFAQYLTEDTE